MPGRGLGLPAAGLGAGHGGLFLVAARFDLALRLSFGLSVRIALGHRGLGFLSPFLVARSLVLFAAAFVCLAARVFLTAGFFLVGRSRFA